MTQTQKPLSAVALVCSRKPSPAESSSELIAEHVFTHLRERGVTCEVVRAVDHAIAPGVETDMGEGDEWPAIRRKILDADILLLSTPVWLGHPSSVAQRRDAGGHRVGDGRRRSQRRPPRACAGR